MSEEAERSPRRAGADVQVCIVSYDSASILRAALASVRMTMPAASIAVREHGGAQAFAALSNLVESIDTPIYIESDPTNPGFGAGCNALARHGASRWLLFLNPDAELMSWPWTAESLPPVDQITGPEMLGSGETERHTGRSWSVYNEIERSWLRRSGERPDGAGFVSGAALLVDRASFERVGGFDPAYFMFYEDIELCLRANDMGVAIRTDPRWTVRHKGRSSTRALFAASLQWSYESAVHFHGRSGSRLVGYRSYVVADALARAMMRTVLGKPNLGRAYLGLARRAFVDLARLRRHL